MSEQTAPERVIGKTEGKSKEPQKFVYLQLQQDRTGDGSGCVATLLPGRGSGGSAHFIPLTAKLNSISVLGSGSRTSRPAMSVPTPRNQGTAVVTMASPRPVAASAVSASSARSVVAVTAVTVSNTRPVIAPVTTVAARVGSTTTVVRKAHSNVVVSSGVSRPLVSASSGATITVLGSGSGVPAGGPTVLRPATSQGPPPPHASPVIFHTSKVNPPHSPAASGTKVMSPRLVPIPLNQVRSGSNNKAVLSYNAILQQPGSGVAVPGGGGGGSSSGVGGGGNGSCSSGAKKESPAVQQQLLLHAAPSSGVKGGAAALAKASGATISIITGKGGKGGGGGVPVATPASGSVNMLSLNLAQSKSNMINFKISNGQIQTDSVQQADVLREARPLVSAGQQIEERKDTSVLEVGTGAVTVSLASPLPCPIASPRSPPIKSPTLPQLSVTPSDPFASIGSNEFPPVLDNNAVFTTRREDDILQRAVSALGGALDEDRDADCETLLDESSSFPDKPHSQKSDNENSEVEGDSDGGNVDVSNCELVSPVLDVKNNILQNALTKPLDISSAENSRSLSPVNLSEVSGTETVKIEKEEEEGDEKENIDVEKKVKKEVENQIIIKSSSAPEIEDDIKPEYIKFSDLLKWENGVGKLNGSDLKFKINEFDAVEIVEDRDLEEIKNHQNKKTESRTPRHHARKPNFRELMKEDEIFSDNSQDSDPQGNKSTREGDDICCCKNCGCYGLSSEFFRDSSFCSVACGDEHDAREIEWGKERLRLEKERQRKRRYRMAEKAGDDQGVEGSQESNRSDAEESVPVSDDDVKANRVLGSDALVSKFQHPWQDGKNNFSWVKYLEHCGRAKGHTKAAPLKIWPEPFPFGRNLFRPGMKLEVIDPGHQSLFCVMTVVETVGYRLRLHFDGYSDQYDFWVNADSPNLFPVGWCEKNGRQLEPPLGVLGFSWKAYLEHCKAPTAPRQAFLNKGNATLVIPNNFRVGMKLEAEDRKNMWVCVATVADLLDNRVLIHFDGWEKGFDFWCEVSSPYIHPVGWCAENNVVLHPPNDYPNPESFNWHEYLQETNSMAVPARAFKTRAPREFKKNMKLEVVDRRNPSLIRVATVVDVQDYQVKIHFDGWVEDYDYWLDDDSPDIHPPSWCSKTSHSLQPPFTPEQQAEDVDSGMGCGTPGCKGIGHIKGPIYTTHHTAYGCPYSLQNINKDPDSIITDRLLPPPEKKKGKTLPKVKLDLRPYNGVKEGSSEVEETDCQKKRIRKRRKFFDELSPPEPNRSHKMAKLNSCNEEVRSVSNASLLQSAGLPTPSSSSSYANTTATATTSVQSNATSHFLPQQQQQQQQQQAPADTQADHGVDMMVHQSVFNPGYNPNPTVPAPHSWERHRHLTAPLGDAKRADVEVWDAEQVNKLVAKIPGCEEVSTIFTEQQIDGEALLMMTQNDLVSLLQMKLGPAIKIMAVIMCLRNSPP